MFLSISWFFCIADQRYQPPKPSRPSVITPLMTRERFRLIHDILQFQRTLGRDLRLESERVVVGISLADEIGIARVQQRAGLQGTLQNKTEPGIRRRPHWRQIHGAANHAERFTRRIRAASTRTAATRAIAKAATTRSLRWLSARRWILWVWIRRRRHSHSRLPRGHAIRREAFDPDSCVGFDLFFSGALRLDHHVAQF